MSRLFLCLLSAVLLLSVVPRLNAQSQTREQATMQERDQVYGWELMSEQERQEHRARMRSLQTEQEREQYRLEHHERMQERARQTGVTLPDPAMPMGQGPGPGPGVMPGMGRGSGGGGPRR